MALLSYNRSIITNEAEATFVPLTGIPTLILEFGLFVPTATNFVELQTSVGWQVVNTIADFQPTLRLVVLQDGLEVGAAHQEALADGVDEPVEMLAAFQTVLTDVTVGHHVYQVLVYNLQPAQGDIAVTGPATISGKVIS